ncbi:uncharacterized protein NPIL_436921 [Nephila pilipes]|uniref:Uncharacterized protein n=1 Tax=Nephila pilipes TaxID=299642 RepID=A0A8X6JBS9_NEPPI|nr:uncharacterized protein NPIL_436921 [Nephila pilipes]
MNITFWPPLQLLAYSKIAQAVLYTFDIDALKDDFMLGGYFSDDYAQKIKCKVSSIPLSTAIQQRLVGIVLTLGTEVVKWFRSHEDILRDTKLNFQNKISWFSFGIIDRFETARSLIRDQNLNIHKRFVLASKYYLEEDVRMLWMCMSENEQKYINRSIELPRSIRHWLKKLYKGTQFDWTEMSLIVKTGEFFCRNHLGLRYYFPKFKKLEDRLYCILNAMRHEETHHFDLYFCLSHMNVKEQNHVFNQLLEYERQKVIELFLNWPLQILFLDVLDCTMLCVTVNIIHGIINFILLERLKKRWEDHEYIYVLKRLWEKSPSLYKKKLEEDKIIYPELMLVFESSDSLDSERYLNYLEM